MDIHNRNRGRIDLGHETGGCLAAGRCRIIINGQRDVEAAAFSVSVIDDRSPGFGPIAKIPGISEIVAVRIA